MFNCSRSFRCFPGQSGASISANKNISMSKSDGGFFLSRRTSSSASRRQTCSQSKEDVLRYLLVQMSTSRCWNSPRSRNRSQDPYLSRSRPPNAGVVQDPGIVPSSEFWSTHSRINCSNFIILIQDRPPNARVVQHPVFQNLRSHLTLVGEIQDHNFRIFSQCPSTYSKIWITIEASTCLFSEFSNFEDTFF